MEIQDILKKVKRIEIKTRRLSDHIFSGEYHTSFKGRGMSFAEVRPYQFGDDIRSIDWNVTARYNEPHVKVFEEERELTLMLMVDISNSQNFGSQDHFKKDIVTEIAATLAFSATQNNDKVGLLLFSDEIELFIAPKKGKSHILRIIRELLNYTPRSKKTDLSQAIEYLSKVVKKKSILFILSDFMSNPYEQTLRIASKRHDITGIRIFDPREKEIPNIGFVPLVDAETNQKIWVNTADSKIRQQYQQFFSESEGDFLKTFHKCGAGTINMAVDESYAKKLLAYFRSR